MFLRFYFTMNVVLLTMLAVSYPFLRPGSASAIVAQLSLLVVVPSVLVSGFLIYRRTRNRGR